MNIRTSINYYNKQGTIIGGQILHNEPESCPLCHKGIKPVDLYGFKYLDGKFTILYLCPLCQNTFMKVSEIGSTDSYGFVESLKKGFLAPQNIVEQIFSAYIKRVSDNFISIYNQAYTAEAYGLSEIAGIGYRKSIEFLIKDYLCYKSTSDDEKEKIQKKPLAKCISEDIKNENIRIVASRAVWIGNDEAHYIRKHEDKDVTDLKRLIDLTVRWIEMELMTKEVQAIEPK